MPVAQKAVCLELEGITKTFGDFVALRDISLEIDAGEFVCFLGPSGCGKTTLLRAIAGLDVQTHGRIIHLGRDISALPPAARDFGIVFQSYALFPNLTAADNVGYGLVNGRKSRSEVSARVRELLELVGLPDVGGKYPSQLSGGQQQRIALARALATSPGLLLLDEPLSALDAKVRAQLRREIKSLHCRLGITTIMVTHDQIEAMTIADRIVVINAGRIAQVGTPAEIYREPASLFVADFIGAMNFLDGTVVGPQRVRIGGVDMPCSCNGLPAGTEITVAVRPEDIVVEPVDNSNGHALEARLVHVEFFGSHCCADLEWAPAGKSPLRVHLPKHFVNRAPTTTAERICVTLPSETIRLFPRGPSAE
jgi:iron(III) transport system ATP-binding protein